MSTPTRKHRLRHPATLVAVVLGALGLLSAAAFAIPGEVAPTTSVPTSAQVAFQRASATRARIAAERLARQETRARQTLFLTAIANQHKAAALRQIAAERAEAARKEAAARRAEAATAAPAGSGRCGGNLPPCCVMNRESGGNIHAENPTSSASGKWQFLDSTWNGYGGYAHASDAPESVQDAKAAQLWAGGAGAGHWGGGC